MTSLARSFAAPSGCPDPGQHGMLRAVVFLPSGREDYVASARMSLEEFLELDFEGGLAEWVDGEVFLYMSATFPHQRVVDFLSFLIQVVFGSAGVGVMATAPYAIVGPSQKAGREPDLVAVTWDHRDRITMAFLDGAPDLAVEVVSDDSVHRDQVEKFLEYQSEAIPEYWVIDPRPGHERASFFVLRDGRYVATAPSADGFYTSAVFPTLRLKVAWLFAERPPIDEVLTFVLATRLR